MSFADVLQIANFSDPGQKRTRNEDSTVSDATLGFAMVADGMGGYKAGEVASAIAVSVTADTVRRGLAKQPAHMPDNNAGGSVGASLLRQAIKEANIHIFRTANTEAQCHGMGTTALAVLFYDNRLCVAHVGDSRMYRLRGETFEQMTSDHSLVQELVTRGFLSKEEALANTPKNLVTRALGVEENVEVDVREEPVEPGDIYLLCSDGLNDMISDEDIRLTLRKFGANLDKAGSELVRIANANGGKDNISVILARVLSAFPAKSAWYNNMLGRIKKGR
jgi:PPM family protein phosphatase